MLQPNLEAYTKRDLQTFLALLSQFDQPNSPKGIGYIRDTISDFVFSGDKKMKLVYRQELKEQKKAEYMCPHCKKGILMIPIINDDGLNIVGCPKCRYSEVR